MFESKTILYEIIVLKDGKFYKTKVYDLKLLNLTDLDLDLPDEPIYFTEEEFNVAKMKGLLYPKDAEYPEQK